MTPQEIKQFRRSLGFSQTKFGLMFDTDGLSIRRMEMPPTAKSSRNPPPRFARLIQAYIDGYRPADWPEPK